MDRRAFLQIMAGVGAGHMGFPRASRPRPRPVSDLGQKDSDHWISEAKEQPHTRPGIWTMFATT
jgi:hypothetical protein